MSEEEKSPFPIVPVVISGAIIAAVTAGIIFLNQPSRMLTLAVDEAVESHPECEVVGGGVGYHQLQQDSLLEAIVLLTIDCDGKTVPQIYKCNPLWCSIVR